MIALCALNGRGRPITRPLEHRLEVLSNLCAPYARIADVGAGQGRLSRRLAQNGAIVCATERTRHGVIELQHYLKDTAISVRQGDGLGPLVSFPAVDAVVMAGMGSVVIQHILEQRHQLSYQPRFVIQVVQGWIAVHRYLRNAMARVHDAHLIRERGRIYATWIVTFPVTSGPTGDWDSRGLLQEFCADPLWPSLCGHEAEIRQNRLDRPLSESERRRVQQEFQYWQHQLHWAILDKP